MDYAEVQPRVEIEGNTMTHAQRVVSTVMAVALLLLASWATSGVATTRTAAVPQERNCFWQLANGRGDELTCEWPAFLTEKERSEIRKYTRELVQDASCLVSIRIVRGLVDTALAARDHEFKAPPQRVTCNVHTKDTVMPISGTFSPRVLLRDGRAVEATPNLGEIQGVHAALAWPVVEYVNRSTTVRDGMLKAINAYLERRQQQAARRS